MVFMEEMRWASMALAVSLESSADQRLVQRMRSWGTQCAYTEARVATAARPLSVSLPPISTRSGCEGGWEGGVGAAPRARAQ